MSDQFNEQISQFIDDEMSVDESEFFVRRLQRDVEARRRYLRYQLIGAAMRGEHFHPGATELGLRLGQAIDRDESAARSRSATRLATGVGIAASVAVVALFGFRFADLGSDSLAADPAAASDFSDAPAAASNLADAPSYVMPSAAAEIQPLVRVGGEATGIQYLIHHARYSSGLSRTIMQSSVVAGQESDPTESTEEEVVE
ncbi:MAG TPA: sigma-E factor negative regulatory protein [Gammaproteobacteria bacterium]|nr:sigma-E factor negative regulatory protein [Gammaproteobacteria bacterium]